MVWLMKSQSIIVSILIALFSVMTNIAHSSERVIARHKHDKIYNISDFGLTPDSVTVNTAGIQNALNLVAKRGGGVLNIAEGVFVAGTLHIPSNVCLYLGTDATILGSLNPYDYEGYALEDGDDISGLIVSEDTERIAIRGNGVINGRGLDLALAIDSLHHIGERIDPNYSKRRMRPSLRPKLLDFKNVKNLEIENVNLRSSAAWGLSLNKCAGVTIKGINFINRAYWNNDGIDVTDSKDVLIENCYIDSADDGIVLKSFDPEDGNDRITVLNCEIRSSASAFKIGTESFGHFRNVRVKGLRIKDTYRSAVALETVDGAVMEDVVVEDIDAENTGNAIFIRLGHRRGNAPGALEGIVIRNLRCSIPFGRADEKYDLRGPGINVIHNPFPSSITGLPDAKVKDVMLENIFISYPGRGTKGMGYIGRYRWKDIPEARDSYPEYNMFGELPAWGFYIRHVDGVEFNNVTVVCREKDYRDVVVMDDVSGLKGEVKVADS